ncbi:MAG: adenosylhomocysteinase [Candidatus Acetothermia bacterium]
MSGNVKDPKLAPQGRDKIQWARTHMPVVDRIEKSMSEDKPFQGQQVGVCIHLEAKTARLAQALRNGGAEVAITSSNPLSTQDDVAAALNQEDNITVFARRGVDEEGYRKQLRKILEFNPSLIIDDGGDLVEQLHGPLADHSGNVLGGCEETTTGVKRLKAMDRADRLEFPMFAVNDAKMKYLFDNRYGTGQSTWDAIMRTTNLSVAGSTVVVVGYGWCGRGIAKRAAGLGANVIVVEVDPIKAIEAKMDGYRIMNIREAAPKGDFFVTSTGCIDAIPTDAVKQIREGAILANAGHFNVEINVESLEEVATSRETVRENIEKWTLENGKTFFLLGEGRLVNLVAGDGHPAEIMDISFALQILTARYILDHTNELSSELHSVPADVDEQVARTKLQSMGIEIDELNPGQEKYMQSW